MIAGRLNAKLEEDLLGSMRSLFSGNINSLLLDKIKIAFPQLSRAMIVNWIPEQTEDIYWILIDLDNIAIIEVPRHANCELKDVLMKMLSLGEYRKHRLSVVTRRRLEAAVDLMRTRKD